MGGLQIAPVSATATNPKMIKKVSNENAQDEPASMPRCHRPLRPNDGNWVSNHEICRTFHPTETLNLIGLRRYDTEQRLHNWRRQPVEDETYQLDINSGTAFRKIGTVHTVRSQTDDNTPELH
ncbi:hypothetical protein PENCOP_c011G08332 [Penicillium coprophilum]|uniref:Uncharacterized protein n=1 Tax=Penicillium coprophilum TaxID=36646 RepID=A0A1V6UER3_9EURO|nr:hypothetical protein PENCOP_c011G08332 [Penicillium coprophilum]